MVKQWLCPTCGTGVDSLHCPACGEKALQPKDLTFLGLMTQVFHSVSSQTSLRVVAYWIVCVVVVITRHLRKLSGTHA